MLRESGKHRAHCWCLPGLHVRAWVAGGGSFLPQSHVSATHGVLLWLQLVAKVMA